MTATVATLAAEIVPGDIVVYATLARDGVIRQRVATVATLDVVITDPARRSRTTYPTVRLGFGGGESMDYSPNSVVNTVR